MLNKLRNFSKGKLAGVLVGIIIIPFVFWGMGSVFSGGNTNSIAKINSHNISTQKFADFINDSKITSEYISENINDNIITSKRSIVRYRTFLYFYPASQQVSLQANHSLG